MSEQNLQIKLARRPVGLVKRDDFVVERGPVAEPGEGEVLVRVRDLSLDPAMRGWLNDVRSYVPPVGIGEVMRAGGIGEVVTSRDPALAAGDVVSGSFGWQRYAVCKAAHASKIDESIAPARTFLSVLGSPGLTAYFGLLDVGALKPGEQVLVSAASGAVGSVVGQLARIKGARAVGVAGGPAKCAMVVDELGLDDCVDYKSGESLSQALRRSCPKGIDVYFDNVGGEVLDTALRRMARGGRIVVCGAISTYNATEAPVGPANYMALLVNRARMEGFVVFDYVARFPEAIRELAGYVREGRIVVKEHVVEGLENAVEALNMLFSGKNTGKLILHV
jgi:NADPH-dependent curcumin reductase CurA